MELPPNEWLSEIEIEDIASNLDPLSIQQLTESLANDLQNPQFNAENCTTISNNNPLDNPMNTQFHSSVSSPSSGFFTFHNSTSLDFHSKSKSENETLFPREMITWGDDSTMNPLALERGSNYKGSGSSSNSRSPQNAQDHVVAERKRREKLAHQFIALSTLVPGLKKTDKVSLLGGAIEYLKQLEQKVKTLEEGTRKGVNTRETSQIRQNNDELELDFESLPRVEASIEGSTILLRIQCEKRKGALIRVLSEIEKLCLSVINTSVVPFASSSLNVTVTAEIEEGFSMTVVDVARKLGSAIREFK